MRTIGRSLRRAQRPGMGGVRLTVRWLWWDRLGGIGLVDIPGEVILSLEGAGHVVLKD